MKKYVVIAGHVTSKTDGDVHFISCARLCELYGVDPAECYFADRRNQHSLFGLPDDLIWLGPRFDGDYTFPKEEEILPVGI